MTRKIQLKKIKPEHHRIISKFSLTGLLCIIS